MYSLRIVVDAGAAGAGAGAGAVAVAAVAGKRAVPVQADNSHTGYQDGEFAKEKVGLEE